MNINDKIIFRTCGRGKTRVWKGTIKYTIKAGKLPVNKTLQKSVPHGDKPSNRDRFIVALDKTNKLVWANATGPNIVLAGKKLPEHNPRIDRPKAKVVKPKLKVKVKVKAKAKAKAKVEPRGPLGDNGPAAEAKPRKGGDKPKTTWYGIVDGKIVSVRKVVCPEGFSTEKPVLTAPVETPPATTPAVPAAETALPQASAV
jgi:hypothetical protein